MIKTIRQAKVKDKILVPTTPEEFDLLIKKIMASFKQIKNHDHAVSIVANRISHMGPDQAETTIQYFGYCIIKNISYQIAQAKASFVQQKIQIDTLIALLETEPNNQQALDSLTQASDEGSEYAKTKLVAFLTPKEPEGKKDSKSSNAFGTVN